LDIIDVAHRKPARRSGFRVGVIFVDDSNVRRHVPVVNGCIPHDVAVFVGDGFVCGTGILRPGTHRDFPPFMENAGR
jgi:hypothetical protein